MARIVLALAAGAAALAPGSKPAAQTRRELGQGLVAAVGALGAQAAVASAGDSPKFSFFGFFGNGGTLSQFFLPMAASTARSTTCATR